MMKKTKKKHVQNNDLSHPISKSNKKKSIFAIVELTICVACILFLTIPFIKNSRFVYPIPDGQDMPDMTTSYWSYVTAGLHENNPIGLITTIFVFLTIGTIILWFIKNKSKASRNIYYANISLFIISFILLVATYFCRYPFLSDLYCLGFKYFS